MKKSYLGIVLASFGMVGMGMAQVPPSIPIPPPPRIVLQNPASQPMQIQEMDVKAKVRGLYATVETTLSFLNPNKGSVLEGTLEFPLPDRATVCGYAIEINGVFVDGVVVPKEKARIVFEAETARGVDPGLVEHVKGNVYRTRIYPLPPAGIRKVRLAYTMPLALDSNGDAGFVLPMPRKKMARRSLSIEVADIGAPEPKLAGLGDQSFKKAERFWKVSSVESDVTPGADIFVAMPSLPNRFSVVEKDSKGNVWFTATIYASEREDHVDPRNLPKEITILWDGSGSRANASLKKDLDLIDSLPLAIRSFRLIVFRDCPERSRLFSSKADLIEALKKVEYDGGTDFHALRSELTEKAPLQLLFTDGLETMTTNSISFSGCLPTAIISSPVGDRESLRQACGGNLIDLENMSVREAIRQIFHPPLRLQSVEGKGIADVQGIGQPLTGRLSVLGRLVADSSEIRFRLGTFTFSDAIQLRKADAREGNQLATAWAAARVTQLTPQASAFADELLQLGRTYGVVSPVTSLLVLDTLDQWVRYEIEPPASLPELRKSWFAAMKHKTNGVKNDQSQHVEQLVKLWNERIKWWKRDYEKNPLPTESAIAVQPRSSGIFRRESRVRRAAGHVEIMADAMAVNEAAPVIMEEVSAASLSKNPSAVTGASAGCPKIEIRPWSPETPYLQALKKEKADQWNTVYYQQRKSYSTSPGFYLDCAEFFFRAGQRETALRVLSNLAELKIEDSGLLRVFAWRLRQEKEYDQAIVLLRRIVGLRGEEPQSYRDLATVLMERGKAKRNRADLEEALNLFVKVAMTSWPRHQNSILLFAVEEYNALVGWINSQVWPLGEKPAIPSLDKRLCSKIDVDVRIVLSWDADATDIDLHVIEPSLEEAFYAHNRTTRGGMISQDVVDGYGPEEYMIRKAPHGMYQIRANYFGSHQQTAFGPATVSATVFTNWGRKNEAQQMLTLRLEKEKENLDVGTITFGGEEGKLSKEGISSLRIGMSEKEVIKIIGQPNGKRPREWDYLLGRRTVRLFFTPKGLLSRVEEFLPGGIRNVLAQ